MRTRNSQEGNTLALVLIVVMAVLVIAYFVINFGQLLGTHKEAQTAIDAAALAAAKDISKVVIDEKDGSHFGVVALVDDVPRKKDNRPVLGINTVMATIRLDAIIANKLNSSTMLVLVAHDLERAQADSLTLRKKILQAMTDGQFADKDGNKINLLQDVTETFDANSIRLSQGERQGNIIITAGEYTSAHGTTNIPVPTPQAWAQVDNTNSAQQGATSFYQPLVDAPVNFTANGNSGKLVFKFIPVSDRIAISDATASGFTPTQNNSPGYFPPYLVKVEADMKVVAASQIGAGSNQKNGQNQQTNSGDSTKIERASVMHVAAVAHCGAPRQTFGTGLLQLAFPGGVPPKGQGPDCTSVKTMITATQIKLTHVPPEINAGNNNIIGAEILGTPSTYKPAWNILNKGAWLKAQGGAVPANASATLAPNAAYRARVTDDPSVVLSYCVYDWLHAMYLRPNAEAMVNGLSGDLGLYGATVSGRLFDQNSPFVPAAYASVTPKFPVTFGLFKVPEDGQGDPRDLRNFADDPSAYRRQLPNVFGYLAAEATLPDQSLVVAMDGNSNVVTTNGEPASTLVDFFHALIDTNKLAIETFKNGQAAMRKLAEEIKVADKEHQTALKSGNKERIAETKKKLEALENKVQRPLIAVKNAYYVNTLALAVLNDRKALSGLGVTKVNKSKFEIISGAFYPPTKAGTLEEILGDGPVATGQDSGVQKPDWLVPTKEGIPQLQIFVDSEKPAIGVRRERDSWFDTGLQPVLAATSVPQSQNNIRDIFITGDVTAGDHTGGTVTVNNPATTTSGVNVIEGQLIYQNTSSLITTSPNSSDVYESWNCISRDNGANYAANTSFFGNSNDAGYNGISSSGNNPPLIAEWSLRCPAPSGPNFCTNPDGSAAPVIWITTGADTGLHNNLTDITYTTDAAGNLSYFFQGKPMHFAQDYNTWISANNTFFTGTGPLGGGKIGRDYGNVQATWTGYMTDYYPNFATHFGNSLVSYFYNMAQVPSKAGNSYLYNIWAVYNADIFWTNTGSCAQLYKWSS
jgi:hypothetical protein